MELVYSFGETEIFEIKSLFKIIGYLHILHKRGVASDAHHGYNRNDERRTCSPRLHFSIIIVATSKH